MTATEETKKGKAEAKSKAPVKAKAAKAAPVKAPAKAAKAPTKAAAAPAKGKVAKPVAKAAKAPTKGTNGHTAPVKRAKGESKVVRDQYGFKEGSLKSKAAALYANKKTKGATLAEVKAAIDSSQLNLLKQLEGKGFTITKVKEGGAGKKPCTRYLLGPAPKTE